MNMVLCVIQESAEVLSMACRLPLADRQPHKAWEAFKQGQDRSRILDVLNLPLANGSGPAGSSQASAASQAAASLQQLRLAILAGAIASNDKYTIHQVSHCSEAPLSRLKCMLLSEVNVLAVH